MSEPNFAVVFMRGTAEIAMERAQFELARMVGEHLHATYPGYLWRVNADFKGGIVNILCADVSMEKGCTLMASDFANSVEAMKLVTRAGGELLERARLHRGRMRETELVDAKRDLRGNIITD